jgi:hypothetical protein
MPTHRRSGLLLTTRRRPTATHVSLWDQPAVDADIRRGAADRHGPAVFRPQSIGTSQPATDTTIEAQWGAGLCGNIIITRADSRQRQHSPTRNRRSSCSDDAVRSEIVRVGFASRRSPSCRGMSRQRGGERAQRVSERASTKKTGQRRVACCCKDDDAACNYLQNDPDARFPRVDVQSPPGVASCRRWPSRRGAMLRPFPARRRSGEQRRAAGPTGGRVPSFEQASERASGGSGGGGRALGF